MENKFENILDSDSLQFRGILEKNRKLIQETDKNLMRHARDELTPEGLGEITKIHFHHADSASDIQELNTIESLAQKNIKSMQEVDDALARIDKGNYGVCLGCGCKISLARLKIVPETRYCIDCQLDFEDKMKKTGENQLLKDEILKEKIMPQLEVIRKISVGDLIQKNIITVRSDENLIVAIELLNEFKIRHLPVVDEQGDLVGIISDRDLLGLVLNIKPWNSSQQSDIAWSKTRVFEVMTKTPEAISAETTLFEAGNLLLDNKISCLPVVEGNRLLGIITESDFVKLVSQIT